MVLVVRKGDGWVVGGWHELSEHMVCMVLKVYSGQKVGCHACARTTDNGRNVKIEQELWKQNS